MNLKRERYDISRQVEVAPYYSSRAFALSVRPNVAFAVRRTDVLTYVECSEQTYVHTVWIR
jgi:hypothetical protein